jgi:hypothetical protein
VDIGRLSLPEHFSVSSVRREKEKGEMVRNKSHGKPELQLGHMTCITSMEWLGFGLKIL